MVTIHLQLPTEQFPLKEIWTLAEWLCTLGKWEKKCTLKWTGGCEIQYLHKPYPQHNIQRRGSLQLPGSQGWLVLDPIIDTPALNTFTEWWTPQICGFESYGFHVHKTHKAITNSGITSSHFYVFICFWLHWIAAAVCRLPPAVASGAALSWLCTGFSLQSLLLQSSSSGAPRFP